MPVSADMPVSRVKTAATPADPATANRGRHLSLHGFGCVRTAAAAVVLLLVAIATSPRTATAQTLIDDPGAAISLSDYQGAFQVGPDGRHYLILRHQINDGVGYDGDGFTTLGGHATLYDFGLTHLFGEARAHITNHSRVGYSALLGARRQAAGGVLGIWAGYDNWETNLGNDYDQIAVGAEAMFCNFDLRGNGYFVSGDEVSQLGFLGKSGDFRFTGNSLVFTDPALFEEALSGFDVEAGVPVPFAPWMRAYGGVYGYDSNFEDTVIGGRGRAEVRVSNEVSLNFIASHDDIYGDSFNVVGEYRFDGRVGNNVLLPAFNLGYRKHAPVRRNWPVATRLIADVADRTATNPDGSALSFAIVDNTVGGTGDGTFENPFTTLPQTIDQSVIIVRSSDTDYVGNIALQDNQRLFGEGKPILIDTDCGVFNLVDAGISDGSGRGPGIPRMMGTPTIVSRGFTEDAFANTATLTLANGNIVRGVNFVAPGEVDAITGDGINDFTLDCVVATGGNGLLVDGFTGTGTILDSTFNTIDGAGIAVRGLSGTRPNLVFRDVDINGVGPGAMQGILVGNDDGGLAIDFADIDIAGVGSGLTATTRNGDLLANLSDIEIERRDGVGTNGFQLGTSNGSLVVRGDELTASGLSGTGMELATTDGFVDAVVSDSTFSGNTEGVSIETVASQGRVSILGTQANANLLNGVEVDADDGSSLTVNLGNSPLDGNASQIAANGMDNVSVNATGGSNVSLNATDVLAIGAGRSGFSFISGTDPGTGGTADDGSNISVMLSNVDASGAGAFAIDGLADNASSIDYAISGFDGSNAGLVGLNTAATFDSTVTGFVNAADFSDSDGFGIILESEDGAVINLDMTDITAVRSAGAGLVALAMNGGVPSAIALDVTNGNFSASGDDNIFAAAFDDSQIDLGLNNVLASGSLNGDGVDLNALSGGDIRVMATDLEANANLNGNGIVADAIDSGSSVTLGGMRVAANNNGLDGLEIDATDQGRIDVELADSSTNGNLLNGIDIDLDSGSVANLNLIAPFSSTGNLRDGIQYRVDDGSVLNLEGDSLTLSNNGRLAIDGAVNGAGSSADLNLANTLANNGGEGGIRLDVGTATGPVTQSLVLVDSQVNSTGGNGLDVSVANGSGFDGFVDGTSFSGNAVDGVNLTADSATASISFTDSAMDANGDDGLDFAATSFSDVDISALNTTASNNAGNGVEGDSASNSATGATFNNLTTTGNGADGVGIATNNARTFLNHLNSVSSNNGGRGLELSSIGNSELTLNAVASAYLDNAASGVMVFTQSLGFSDLLFDGTVANQNGMNGYELTTANDALLVTQFAGGASGSGNVDAGLSVASSSGSSTYFSTVDALGTFADNSSLAGNGVEFNLIDQAVAAVDFAGNVTGAADDGINIQIINATEAAIQVGDAALSGVDANGAPVLADVTGNGGDGISILTQQVAGALSTNVDVQTVPARSRFAGTTFNPFLIEANNVSGSGEFGIVYNAFNTDLAAGTDPRIVGNIANGTGQDGIRTEFSNSNVPGDFSILTNDSSDNAGFGIAVILDNTPVGNLVIEENNVEDNQLGGIVVIGNMGSTLSAGSIANNVVQDNGSATATMNAAGPVDNGGDGIAIRYDGAAINNLSIVGNESSGNAGRGLLFDLVDAPVTNLNISDNGTMVVDRPSLTFDIVGNTLTQPFSVLNSSIGFDITSLFFNAAPSNNDFDPEDGPFQPVGMTDVLTGLVSVNGMAITPGTDPLEDAMMMELEGGGVMDEDQTLNLVFNDFNPGETFQFDLDVDEVMTDSTVLGSDLIGSIVTIGFMNGDDVETLTGTLTAVDGQANASQFVAVGASDPGFSGNGDEGIRFNAVRSDLTNVLIDNNTIDNNGDDGIDIALIDSNLINADITGNVITDSGDDAIRLVDPETGFPIDLTIAGNVLADSGGRGLNLQIDDTTDLSIDGGGNTIIGNDEGGVVLIASDESTFDLRLGNDLDGQQSLAGNSDNGIAVLLTDEASGSLAIDNVDATGTLAGDGLGDALAVILEDNSELALSISDSSFSDSDGRGISLDVSQSTVLETTTITDTTIDGNDLQGLRLVRQGSALVEDLNVTGGSISDNGADGVEIALSGGATNIRNGNPLTIDTTIIGTDINNNAENGIEFQSTADVQSTLTVGGGMISSNSGNGIRAAATINATQAITVNGTEVSSNGGEGVFVTAVDDTTSSVTVANATVSENNQAGFIVAASDNSTVAVDIAMTAIENNGQTAVDAGPGVASGIELSTLDDSRLDVTITDSQISGTQQTGDNDEIVGTEFGSGLTANVFSTRGAQIDLTRVDLLDNTNNGIEFFTANGSTLVSTMVDVRANNNGQQGLQIDNAGSGTTTSVAISGTVDPQPSNGSAATSSFSGNGSNGILAVNTPDAGQAATNLDLQVINTSISGNGSAADAMGDDLIGFLALSGTDFPALPGGEESSLDLDVQNNVFRGNTGVDFVTRSFVAVDIATVADPAETGAYQFDPVARLRLNLIDNVGDQIDVTQAGALFTNADEFKSPGSIFLANDDRARSGQRVARDVAGVFSGMVTAVQGQNQFQGDLGLPPQDNRFNDDFLTFTSGLNAGESNDILEYQGPGVAPDGTDPGIPARTFAFEATDDSFDEVIAIGDMFTIDAIAVNGVGASTFVTTTATIADGGNQFDMVLSDFDDLVGGGLFDDPAADANLPADFAQAFGWTVDPTLTHPVYDAVILNDPLDPFMDMSP